MRRDQGISKGHGNSEGGKEEHSDINWGKGNNGRWRVERDEYGG